MSTKVNFVLLLTLLKSFFRYSTMTSMALSRRTDGYKLTTSYDIWISVGDIFHVFASLTNSKDFLIFCWLLFSVGWIILTRYLEIPYGGVPVGKNQIIFLQRCIYHNITPKSFRLKTPIKLRKAFHIMKVYKTKLIVIAKKTPKKECITQHSRLTNLVKL